VLKIGVETVHPPILRNTAPNSSNKVSIPLQEFLHWIFLSHCRLVTSSANLRVTITSVRWQPCFNVVQNGCGDAVLSLTRSHPTIPLKKSHSQTKCAGHDEGCNQHFSTRASFKPIFALFYQNGSRTYGGPRTSADRVTF